MHRILPAFLLIGALIGAFLVYRPGLPGPFLLDDEPNLQGLATSPGHNAGGDIVAFLAAGRSGPTGRPLSLLSFFIDDNAWPSEPRKFKYTNLLLHILNGTLVAWLAFRLALIAGSNEVKASYVAVVVSALWLVHPLNVSTVLYVVQRMTILSTMFVLAGLIAYTHGRAILAHQPGAGLSWTLSGLVFGTLLATLSKENGVLLPVYALLIEAFFFRSTEEAVPKYWRYWRFALLYVPAAALVLYFPFNLSDINLGYNSRSFTVSERLLTESRILLDYLRQIIVPRIYGTGLFHDDYVISRSVFDPLETALSIAFWAVTSVFALRLRRRYPLLLFSLLWFVVGHVLESTFVPLELYFEHRNYFPMFGFLFAGTYGLLAHSRTPLVKMSSRALIAGLLIAFAGMTFSQAQVWASPYALAAVWSAEKPNSSRAQQMVANLWLSQGDYRKAKQGLMAASRFQPDNPGLLLQVLQVSCLGGMVSQPEIEQANSALREHASPNSSADVTLLTTLPKLYRIANQCSPLSTEHLDAFVSDILKNQSYGAELRSALYYLRGTQYAERHELDAAMKMLDSAYALRPNVDIALLQSYWLITAGLYDEALAYADIAMRQDGSARWPFRNLRRTDIDGLRQRIEELK